MSKNAFADVAAVPGCAQWEALIRRETGLYHRDDEVRSEFARDYTRLLHSLAYRRLNIRHRFSITLTMTMCVRGWSMWPMSSPSAERLRSFSA